MKQFLVILVSLPIMLMLLTEFVYSEFQMTNMITATQYVYAAKENASRAGMFTDEIKNDLKENIEGVFGEDCDVEIESSVTSPVRRNASSDNADDWCIDYKISFSIGRLYLGLGVDKTPKTYRRVISGFVPSEY